MMCWRLPARAIPRRPGGWKSRKANGKKSWIRRRFTSRARKAPRVRTVLKCAICLSPGNTTACAATPLLFDSAEKFQSGTGWPSFTQAVSDNVVAYHEDGSFGRVRIEVTCNVCDAHLGHVFQDGPPPSGLRYCINAVSLTKAKTR